MQLLKSKNFSDFWYLSFLQYGLRSSDHVVLRNAIDYYFFPHFTYVSRFSATVFRFFCVYFCNFYIFFGFFFYRRVISRMEVGCVTYFVEKGDTTTREHNSTLYEEEALEVVPFTII